MSSVTNMSHAFYCAKAFNADISCWVFDALEDADTAFVGASSLVDAHRPLLPPALAARAFSKRR